MLGADDEDDLNEQKFNGRRVGNSDHCILETVRQARPPHEVLPLLLLAVPYDEAGGHNKQGHSGLLSALHRLQGRNLLLLRR